MTNSTNGSRNGPCFTVGAYLHRRMTTIRCDSGRFTQRHGSRKHKSRKHKRGKHKRGKHKRGHSTYLVFVACLWDALMIQVRVELRWRVATNFHRKAYRGQRCVAEMPVRLPFPLRCQIESTGNVWKRGPPITARPDHFVPSASGSTIPSPGFGSPCWPAKDSVQRNGVLRNSGRRPEWETP
jgi:hypothetical protein